MMKQQNRFAKIFFFILSFVTIIPLCVPAQDNSPDRIVLLYTGDSEAVLEPCGCKGDDLGGIDVRAKKIRDILGEAYPTVILENAGAFASGTMLDKLRTEKYLELLQRLDYDGLHIGRNDIVFGPDFIREHSEKLKYPFLSSNLRFATQSTPWWEEYLIKELDGWKVGIIGLMPETEKPEDPEGCFWSEPPLDVARKIVSKLKNEEEVDVLILLSDLPRETETEIAGSLPIDIVISNNPGTPFGKVPGTNAICLTTTHQSRTMGRLDIGMKTGTDSLGFRHESVPLRRPEGFDDEILQEVRAFYAQLLADPKWNKEAVDPMADLGLESSGEHTYVGADGCKECHAQEYRYWSARTHKQAYRTLLKKQKYYYPQCLGCHVTGLNSESGFKTVDPHSPMAGVQCESCHGPASQHVEEPEKNHLRIDKSKQFCARCHTPEWTPDFDKKYKGYYKSYFPHVQRP